MFEHAYELSGIAELLAEDRIALRTRTRLALLPELLGIVVGERHDQRAGPELIFIRDPDMVRELEDLGRNEVIDLGRLQAGSEPGSLASLPEIKSVSGLAPSTKGPFSAASRSFSAISVIVWPVRASESASMIGSMA